MIKRIVGIVSGCMTSVTVFAAVDAVWVNDGGDKITREETRMLAGESTKGATWNGSKVTVWGAKNEVVSFAVILESKEGAAKVTGEMSDLKSGSTTIVAARSKKEELFDFKNRWIELFYVRYLPIKGLSRLSYENYDERQIPRRFRRGGLMSIVPGKASGGWKDRPDADRSYPEIAVPLELVPDFSIAAKQSQMIWVDVTIPKNAVAGLYSGQFTVKQEGKATHTLPVELTVKNFTLADEPSLKTMLFMGYADVNERYLGERNPQGAQSALVKKIRDRHFMLAHRHRISMIDANDGPEGWTQRAPREEWVPRLNGDLFTEKNGYAGPGAGVGNGVFSIGTYGGWNWKDAGAAGMASATDAWEQWFKAKSPSTERFLYLVDESSDFAQTEKWAKQVKDNRGVGKSLKTFATIPLIDAAKVPSLDIAASWFAVASQPKWSHAYSEWKAQGKEFFMYNGKRPATGSFATEDDGVALRALAWAQWKMKVDRWFFWESTYYNNYQAGAGNTNVFQTAHTFGKSEKVDPVLGETGWNYSNGDGVLFYPGTDKVFPAESYDIQGPIVSLRLKHWRRGIQDAEYLTMASKKNKSKVASIVQNQVPKVLWEPGVANESDPSYVKAGVSWSDQSADWEKARAQLAEIIAN